MRHALAVLARGVEADLGPALLGDSHNGLVIHQEWNSDSVCEHIFLQGVSENLTLAVLHQLVT